MSRHLLFANFTDANDFLKKVRIGKVQRKPSTDLFVWDSEDNFLTEELINLIGEANGSKFVWADNDTQLSWLFRWHTGHFNIQRLNEENYGGHNDWRIPSLRELKTLGSNVKSSFGCYAKEGVQDQIRGNYISCTPYMPQQDKAWWNFDKGCSTTEEHSEGKIRWNSEGGYGGFDKDRYHNAAKLALVRGTEAQTFLDWAKKLLEWAETDRVFDFPATQRNIDELESLALYYAKDLPIEITHLPKLKRLLCYANPGIEDALFSIASLEQLEVLRPSHTEPSWNEIPASVGNLRHLVSLKAQVGLKNIDSAIGSLGQLKTLDLSYNKIEFIPDSIGNLAELQHLHVWGHFDELPKSIGNLAKLETLTIRSNKLARIPESLCRLCNLKRLLCGAPLVTFLDHLEQLKFLKSLEIENALFQSMPKSIFAMHWLQTLKMSQTPITQIPDEISGMANLEQLDLSGTQITDLPRSMLLMKNLRFLNVSSTRIALLPEWLSDMKSLSRIAGKGVEFPAALKSLQFWVS